MLEKPLEELRRIQSDWLPLVEAFVYSDFGQKLDEFLEYEDLQGRVIKPQPVDIFRCFSATPFFRTKVVILGQDPYPGPGIAQGLAFSAPYNSDTPASLRNIFKELKMDLRAPRMEIQNNLASWAAQGVLLLNTVLTITDSSHKNKGWEVLIKEVLERLQDDNKPRVFLLWGRDAQKLITHKRKQHLYLEAAHPSPLSAHKGFFFQRHFSKTNKFLRVEGYAEIDWLSVDRRRASAMWGI